MSDPCRFDDPALALPEALRRALAQRGYETAMPVQAAILAPASRGRDLLVSSPTGSGKTIAFGAALAETLLERVAGGAGDAAVVPAPPAVAKAGFAPPASRSSAAAAPPRALVVVPTRELAVQVREELGWLLAGTRWRLASFTGGTAVSGDLRTLRRGVDIAIGTPGRLCDLVRRETLSLGGLAAVVLDEADEMLDLGFREDLEFLLGTAPVARRTLLFSATLPAPIRALARRFQRDALAVDARRATRSANDASPSGAHEDITYVAHLIAGDDRLAAVINVLRGSGAERAIVFCTTRDSVGALHRELVARGFSATAISGERAQAERDRALDQLRQGEARVLVATNVAARGLHLPEVDLIVHADLPLNVESLTHRSGRTGRAGRKGTAVVIASLGERRKAERLLSAARLRLEWTAPPSARAIAAAALVRLGDSLAADPAPEGDATEAAPSAAAAGVREDVDGVLEQLRARMSIDDLARRLLARELARLPAGEPLLPVHLPSAGGGRAERNGDDPAARRRGPADFSREGVLFRVNIGAQNQADPRWLLPLICRRGGVTRREVGAIRVGPQETLFEIAGDAAADFARAASQRDPRAPQVRVERADRAEPARQPQRVERAEPARQPERVERAEPARQPERVERAEPARQPERVERAEPARQPERVERAEPARQPERVERAEPAQRPERVERPRRPQRVERPAPVVERFQRPVPVERSAQRPARAAGGGGFQPPVRRGAAPSGASDARRPRPDSAPARAHTAHPHPHARPAHASARPAPARPAHPHARPAHAPAHPRPHHPHPRARKPRG